MNTRALTVSFCFGLVISAQEMAPNTIYLDGACRGPHIDGKRRAYSFDHHGECSRFATQATCEQVMLALELGLNPNGFEVVLNNLDADGSVALWLLRNPDRASDPRVREAVEQIGFVDAHGGVRPATKLHKSLTRDPRITQTIEMLWEDQGKIDAWYAGGDEALAAPFEFEPCPAFGLTASGELKEFESVKDFDGPYGAGCVVAVLYGDAPHGTSRFTIAKRSDFVGYDIPAFLARMNVREPGWSGASTIGGAPRQSDGKRSNLSVETVRNVFLEAAAL